MTKITAINAKALFCLIVAIAMMEVSTTFFVQNPKQDQTPGKERTAGTKGHTSIMNTVEISIIGKGGNGGHGGSGGQGGNGSGESNSIDDRTSTGGDGGNGGHAVGTTTSK